jgi:hypothetical protein
MKRIIIITISVIFLLNCASVFAGPLYSKPEFRGRIINAETKEPIEGAVAVVLYDKWPIISGPGGPNSYIFHAKETLTDSKGDFYIPSFSSLTLSSLDAGIRFIFYKPGYMADYGPTNIKPILMESYFSAGKVGEELEIEGGTFEQGSYVKWKGQLGILELKKAKTREEKWKAPMVFTSSLRANDLPLLYKAIDAAEKDLKKEGIR